MSTAEKPRDSATDPASRRSTPAPDIRVPSVQLDDDPVELLLEEVVEDPEAAPLLSGRSLRGRCVIITGAATGIGREIALEFARQGSHIAFNYLDDSGDGSVSEAAKSTAREITQLEVRVHFEECDVRDPEAVTSFVRRAEEALGGLHILVNNAGIARDRALWRLSDEHWREVLDTNLTGAFHMIRAVAPTMRSQDGGKIVNISSVHALRSEFGVANYSASKAGLLALTRSAAVELGPSNVNVNAVAPGFIRTTRMSAGIPSEIIDKAREKSVLGRLGDPQDVAHVVVFLCTELARHITGAVIPVDGGQML